MEASHAVVAYMKCCMVSMFFANSAVPRGSQAIPCTAKKGGDIIAFRPFAGRDG